MYTGGGKGGPESWTEEDLVDALHLRRPPLYYSTLNVESVSTGLKPNDTKFTSTCLSIYDTVNFVK